VVIVYNGWWNERKGQEVDNNRSTEGGSLSRSPRDKIQLCTVETTRANDSRRKRRRRNHLVYKESANTKQLDIVQRKGERPNGPSTTTRMAAVKQVRQESHEGRNMPLHACPKGVVLEEGDDASFVSSTNVLGSLCSALANERAESFVSVTEALNLHKFTKTCCQRFHSHLLFKHTD